MGDLRGSFPRGIDWKLEVDCLDSRPRRLPGLSGVAGEDSVAVLVAVVVVAAVVFPGQTGHHPRLFWCRRSCRLRPLNHGAAAAAVGAEGAGGMTALVASLFAGPANDVVGAGRC